MKGLKKFIVGEEKGDKIDLSILKTIKPRTIQTKEVLFIVSGRFNEGEITLKLSANKLSFSGKLGYNLKNREFNPSLVFHNYSNIEDKENQGFENFYGKLVILSKVIEEFFSFSDFEQADFLSKFKLNLFPNMGDGVAEIKKIRGILTLKLSDCSHTFSLNCNKHGLGSEQDYKDSIAVLMGIKEVANDFISKIEAFANDYNKGKVLTEVKEKLNDKSNYFQEYILS